MKEIVLTGIGAIGSAIAYIFGGWSTGLTVLLIFMGVDFITGLIVAGVFQKSGKSDSGALSSAAGLKGLLKKGGILVIVIVAAMLDRLTGSSFVRDAAVIAFIANEGLSIIENVGLMGVPIPKVITKAIDALKEKNEDDNDEDDPEDDEE